VPEENMNAAKHTALPPHWKIARLGEACEIILGQSPPSNTYNTVEQGLPFYQGKKEFTELHPVAVKWCSKPLRIAEPNDILLSVRAPVGATNIANEKCCIGRGLAAIRYKPNHKYLYYYLRSVANELDNKGTGSTFKAISGKDIRSFRFPLPPLLEQHRIVAKIEELFSELDNGTAQLKKVKEQLKTYRQSVLKWAFEGKLTEEWREKRISNKEYRTSNDEVSLVAEESQIYQKIYQLPNGWKWVRFGDVHKIKSNLVNALDYLDLPHIAPNNISKGTAKLLSYKTIKEDKVFSPKHKFFKGQIIYSKIRPNLAKVIIAPIDGLCSADMYPIDSKYNNQYTLYYMLTNSFIKIASNTESRTILPKINQKGLNAIPFPLCTLEEQHQIVQEIESRLSVADKLEEAIEQSLQQAEALRQSILKQAFEGKLVPQETNEKQ
jgi:type I restriction enzyme S subunit